MTNFKVNVLPNEWEGYQLLDCGNRRKLERFGDYIIIRSEPKAWWRPVYGKNVWGKAVASCDDDGRWSFNDPSLKREWRMKFGNVTFEARFTNMSKHVGVFPEQSPHWSWMQKKGESVKGRQPKLLNLFGYTGAASLACADAGFHVTHVDASKPALAWARNNQKISGMDKKPIRWLLDDAMKFAQREARRGNKYDAVILDPPSYGRGPNKEIWKVEQGLGTLLLDLRNILSDNPLFVIITMYSIEASPLMVGNMLQDMMRGVDGKIEVGELVHPVPDSDKCLPLSIYGRWEGK